MSTPPIFASLLVSTDVLLAPVHHAPPSKATTSDPSLPQHQASRLSDPSTAPAPPELTHLSPPPPLATILHSMPLSHPVQHPSLTLFPRHLAPRDIPSRRMLPSLLVLPRLLQSHLHQSTPLPPSKLIVSSAIATFGPLTVSPSTVTPTLLSRFLLSRLCSTGSQGHPRPSRYGYWTPSPHFNTRMGIRPPRKVFNDVAPQFHDHFVLATTSAPLQCLINFVVHTGHIFGGFFRDVRGGGAAVMKVNTSSP